MPNPSNQTNNLPAPIAEAVCLLADRLPAEPITWCVGGSVARWLRGFDVTPKDIDLDTGADYLDDITADPAFHTNFDPDYFRRRAAQLNLPPSTTQNFLHLTHRAD